MLIYMTCLSDLYKDASFSHHQLHVELASYVQSGNIQHRLPSILDSCPHWLPYGFWHHVTIAAYKKGSSSFTSLCPFFLVQMLCTCSRESKHQGQWLYWGRITGVNYYTEYLICSFFVIFPRHKQNHFLILCFCSFPGTHYVTIC